MGAAELADDGGRGGGLAVTTQGLGAHGLAGVDERAAGELLGVAGEQGEGVGGGGEAGAGLVEQCDLAGEAVVLRR